MVKADRAIPLPRFKEISRGYDYVFLDGPPRLRRRHVQSAAVAAEDVAVLPIQPGPFDFWAVAETLESLDAADGIREQLGRKPIRRGFVINRAAKKYQARAQRPKTSFENLAARSLPAWCTQRIAFPVASSQGESVLTTHAGKSAADDIKRLWGAVKGGKNGSQSEKTEQRTQRTQDEKGRSKAR